ncbi:hypothetical protein GCM10023201_17430 [Actinomycetospora corticicola]
MRRTRRTTSCPALRRWGTRAVPMRPDDPEMTTRIPVIVAESGVRRDLDTLSGSSDPRPVRGILVP